MREHYALRLAGSTRGIDDSCQIIRLRLHGRALDVPGLALFKLTSLFFQLSKRQPLGGSDSFRIEKDDMLNFRTFAKHVFHFEVLLTIGEKENASARIVQDIAHLRRR